MFSSIITSLSMCAFASYVRQWNRVQEPVNGQHSQTTWHWSHLFCPHHPQSSGKLEFFHKYLKPTLKKQCKKDPGNRDKYINKVLASNCVTPTHCNCWNTLLLNLWKRSQFTPPPIVGIHAVIPGWSCIWMSRPRITLPCTCHSQKNLGWE